MYKEKTAICLAGDYHFTKGELLYVIQTDTKRTEGDEEYRTTRPSNKQDEDGWYINAKNLTFITRELNPEYFL